MRGAVLTRTCGFFPVVVAEVGLRCVEDDLFAWVKTSRKFEETLIALPSERVEAEAMLAARLAHGHQFTPENGLATAQRLFVDAFAAASKEEGGVGDTLCSEEP